MTKVAGGPSGNLGVQGGRVAQLKNTQIELLHFVQVVASAETNIGKIGNIIDDGEMIKAQKKTEVILAEHEIPPDDINFMDN